MAASSPNTPRKPRSSRKAKKPSNIKYPEFAIPYFAHQQLDPTRYVTSVGLPVGKPEWTPAPKEIVTATIGGWENEIDAPLQEDPVADSEEDTKVRTPKRRRPPQKASNPYKRLKVEGGRPATAKKVTADLDSDDELIVRMKNAKYLEKDIAQRLIDEGRVAYHPKTIGTRWARLRKALERRQDDLLDAELTDWHEGDDEVLYQAICKADAIVEKAKADADKRKWRIVADHMKLMKPVTSFSQNACLSRYNNLMLGTAKPTPESIPNPDSETVERIRSRREKEKLIEQDQHMSKANLASLENIEGNAWTSKSHKYL